MTNSKILLELELIPAWRNARAAQASRGLPSMEVRTAQEQAGTDLAVLDTRMLLPPGTRVLSARSCREGAGTGTGSACPGFCGHLKAAKCGLRAVGVLGLFLGDFWVSL